jgi:hypothetical protein
LEFRAAARAKQRNFGDPAPIHKPLCHNALRRRFVILIARGNFTREQKAMPQTLAGKGLSAIRT